VRVHVQTVDTRPFFLGSGYSLGMRPFVPSILQLSLDLHYSPAHDRFQYTRGMHIASDHVLGSTKD